MNQIIPFLSDSNLPLNEPRHEKSFFLHVANQRRRSAMCITAQMISTSNITTQIVQSLNFLNLKSRASSRTARFVSDLVGNPKDMFSHDAAEQLLSLSIHNAYVATETHMQSTNVDR